MELSYKFVLDRRRKNQNGLYQLKIRVYQNNKTTERALGIKLTERDWDEKLQLILKTDTNYKINTYKLSVIKTGIERLLLLSEGDISIDNLLNVMQQRPNSNKITFRQYSQELIDSLLKAKRTGTAMAYRDAMNSLVKHSGNKLTFSQITYKLLYDYNSSMLAHGLKVNSVAAYLRSIRAIYNKAINDKLVSQNDYPFKNFKIKNEKTIFRTLSISDMNSIIELDIKEGSRTWHWRNYFLISFCLIGINFADLLTLSKENIAKDRVVYRRSKTGKIYSIKLHPYSKTLLSIYLNDLKINNDYILPELDKNLEGLDAKKKITQIIKNCNKHLNIIARSCNINTRITTYYARYSWANIAKEIGYSRDVIAEALGHEYGNKVTGIYLDNYDKKVIDEANQQVINAVLDFKVPK